MQRLVVSLIEVDAELVNVDSSLKKPSPVLLRKNMVLWWTYDARTDGIGAANAAHFRPFPQLGAIPFGHGPRAGSVELGLIKRRGQVSFLCVNA
jgi:hypothetical protein